MIFSFLCKETKKKRNKKNQNFPGKRRGPWVLRVTKAGAYQCKQTASHVAIMVGGQD